MSDQVFDHFFENFSWENNGSGADFSEKEKLREKSDNIFEEISKKKIQPNYIILKNKYTIVIEYILIYGTKYEKIRARSFKKGKKIVQIRQS